MIRVEHLNKTYDRHSRLANQALYDVSFTLPDTGFVCLVGPSGCGKTSLLNAIGALDRFDTGSVSTERAENLRCGSRLTEAERNSSFGYIFQNYYLLPEYSAAYNVYLGLHSLDLSHREKLARTMEALRAVGMERFARRMVGQLSGGQQQRVAIARALARRPKVIFADEPTGNLDEANTMNICSLLRQISRSSLVVMVTHEERIARFFADRIITLEAGRLKEDSDGWQRDELAASGNTVYTGEHVQSVYQAEGLTVRLLRAEGAPPVELMVVAQKDRVILKLDDRRTVSCSGAGEPPEVVEGDRPVLKLETLEQEESGFSWEETAAQAKAGSGLPLPMLAREAMHLLGQKGIRRAGTLLFLAVLTILTLLSVGDYLMVSNLDPEDFITTDSHILELQMDWDADRTDAPSSYAPFVREMVLPQLDACGLDFDYLPHVPMAATYSTYTFFQLGSLQVDLGAFSYVPVDRLDPSTLILGRMPTRPDEIVVDRWVLENVMKQSGIIQDSIGDVSYFLDRELTFSKKNYAPTIVGISDCGEPDLFLDKVALISLGVAGTEQVTLSQLREMFPGRYDGLQLEPGQCAVVSNNAGSGYTAGGQYNTVTWEKLDIVETIEEPGLYASIVVADDMPENLLRPMISSRFYLYCADKQAMKDFLAGEQFQAGLQRVLKVSVTDSNSDSWAAYRAATQLRMDARRIVTVTVIALCLVMLYLLQRSRMQERIGMIAVYRLLGIPGRKLAAIFSLECLFQALMSTVPVALVTYLAVAGLSALPSLELPLLLPWYVVVPVCLGILLFHVLACVLPLANLLRLPPARLAAKYDL